MLVSSIFFIAVSVVRGCLFGILKINYKCNKKEKKEIKNDTLIIVYWSNLFVAGTDLRAYLGFRFKRRVLGR